MKVKTVKEMLLGPKHKVAERCAIFDPVTEELITDENEILSTTLKYNIGLLTKKSVAEQDLPEVKSKNELHEQQKGNYYQWKPIKQYLNTLKRKRKICSAT